MILLAVVICTGALPEVPGPSQQPNGQQSELARQGLDLMMDGDLEGAIEAFQVIQRSDPESPLGYLLEANVTWWRIYYATANLIDPDVFDVVSRESTPYDSHFESLVAAATSKAETRIHAGQGVARSYLYDGLAHALKGRLAGLRDKDREAAREGKKMRALSLRALELEPDLTDAYLGIGIYNYFVDTLPTIVKIIRIFMALPGGNRQLGLQQLQKAAESGELSRGEAEFYLAKNFSRPNERQYARSREWFERLAREYPHNPLWPLLVGSLQFRLDHVQEGEKLYRQVLVQTAEKKSEVDNAVHQAALNALRHRHPREKSTE